MMKYELSNVACFRDSQVLLYWSGTYMYLPLVIPLSELLYSLRWWCNRESAIVLYLLCH